jgi:toxin HigB-1
MDIFDVILSESAKRHLIKVPFYVAKKLQSWIENISIVGLRETRKISGYHDEPLQGKRKRQRSIRLSKGYRAFYCIKEDNSIEVIVVLEVNKHDY